MLFRGRGQEVLELARLPALGDVRAFARVELRADASAARTPAVPPQVEPVSVALRLMPSNEPWRSVTASFVLPEELPLLRHVAYALGPGTLHKAVIAVTAQGAFLRLSTGIEGIPVGELFRELRAGLYVPAGYDPVAPDVLYRALGAPSGQVIFLMRDGRVVGVPGEAFVSLETALLEAQAWVPLTAVSEGLASALATELPELQLGGAGIRPMRDVPSAAELARR